MNTFDTHIIKSRIDCRDLIARDLGNGKKRPKYTMYPCPFHQDDQPSLAVYSNGYHCFGCGKKGDALQWLMDYHNLSFQDACARLDDCHLPVPRQPIHETTPGAGEPPSSHWQHTIWNIVDYACEMLWSTAGSRARLYLQQRGLKPQTIRDATLGYIPGHRPRLIDGIKIYPGIFIPWIAAGALWTVKIRRLKGTPKYLQIAGGSTHGLYGADNIHPNHPVLIVEGEFDALIGQQTIGDSIPVVTPGAASYHLSQRWINHLSSASKIVLCMDNDEAGEKGDEHLTAALPTAKIIHTPFGKDLTDLYLQYGETITRQWLQHTIHHV